MFKKMAGRFLATVVCTLVFVGIASAHEISISQRAKIGNGPELQPGHYRVELVNNANSTEVKFFQGHDLVATCPATLTKEGAKANRTEVHTAGANDERVITKIWLSGSKDSFVFLEAVPKAE